MSRDDDIALIRRAYELWERGDFEGVLDLASPDIVWFPPSYALEPGPLRGREEVLRGIASYFEDFSEFRPVPQHILAGRSPNQYVVLAKTYTRGRGSGAEVSMEVAHLIDVDGGRVTRLEVITDQGEALARAGVQRPADGDA